LRRVPGQTGIVQPRPSDVAVGETFSLAAGPSHSEKNHLLVAHTLWGLTAENPDIAEVCGENLTAFGQPATGDDKYQNTSRLQPAIRAAQECRLCATTVSRPKDPVVGRIQIQETEGLDGALYFECVALEYIGNPLPGLLSAAGIKLDAVAKYVGPTGDSVERHAVACAWIER